VWLEEAHHEWKSDNNPKNKIQCIKEGMNSMEHWEWKGDILWYKVGIFLCPQLKSKKKILKESHDSLMVGNAGFLKTYQRIIFFWGGRNEERNSKICKRMSSLPKK